MKIVALLSGGKDSCHNLLHALAHGHELVAAANLCPPSSGSDELDSFSFQTVGHECIAMLAEALQVPLFRGDLTGTAVNQDMAYRETVGDEVEDLFNVLSRVQAEFPDVQGVSTGSILSDYQRLRVEHVCERLNLVNLAFLWQRSQSALLAEMVDSGMSAILIKVAAMGLQPRAHLGKSLQHMRPVLASLCAAYGVHECGEGGEYETLVLDSPLFHSRIILDETSIIIHSADAFAPVGYLRVLRAHLEAKDAAQRNVALKAALDSLRPQTIDMPAAQPEKQMCAVRAVVCPKLLSCGASCVVHDRGLWTVCGLIADPSFSGDVESETAHVLGTLRMLLAESQLSIANVVQIQLNVADMSAFASINRAYRHVFGRNPASRVCVEVPLPPGCGLAVDAVAVADARHLAHMHVQSVSDWAPANIGPYSQAVEARPTGDHDCTMAAGQLPPVSMVWLAGQIGLVPATMTLAPRAVEAAQALRNVLAVLKAWRLDERAVTLGLCYITQAAFAGEARAALVTHAPGCDPMGVLFVPVPHLPRGAHFEWHWWACRAPLCRATLNDVGSLTDMSVVWVCAPVAWAWAVVRCRVAGPTAVTDTLAALGATQRATGAVGISAPCVAWRIMRFFYDERSFAPVRAADLLAAAVSAFPGAAIALLPHTSDTLPDSDCVCAPRGTTAAHAREASDVVPLSVWATGSVSDL